jgi:hypothetical protein
MLRFQGVGGAGRVVVVVTHCAAGKKTTLDSAQGGQEVAAADCKTTLPLAIDDDYSALLSTPILSLLTHSLPSSPYCRCG